jgi:hypothetical protein
VGDLILLLLLTLVIPLLMFVPYLRATRRFYRLVGERGWRSGVDPAWPLKGFDTYIRDRQKVWSKAELGDFGEDAAAALQSMRRRQVFGILFAGVAWGLGLLALAGR